MNSISFLSVYKIVNVDAITLHTFAMRKLKEKIILVRKPIFKIGIKRLKNLIKSNLRCVCICVHRKKVNVPYIKINLKSV